MPYSYLKDTEWCSELNVPNRISEKPANSVIAFLDWDCEEDNEKKPNTSISLNYVARNDNSNNNNFQIDKADILETVTQLAEAIKSHIENGNLVDNNVEEIMELALWHLDDEKKSNNDLEQELIEFFGEQAKALAKMIVRDRKQLQRHFKTYQQYMTADKKPNQVSNLSDLAPLVNNLTKTTKRPAITQSIVIQTSTEKQLKKSIRKLEKKAVKEKKKDEENGFKESHNSPSSINNLLCQKAVEENSLYYASKAPLFQREKVGDREKYPFVFDSFAEAKMSAAFISGHKITLPAGFERTDNAKYEEITIPPCSRISNDFLPEYKLIEIDKDFDEIGKKVFPGVKKLNKVQSIVYNTACFTNNNLLICAPTGAGKTNVAMLTILRELKRHVDPETMKVGENSGENFKIVYIAPMKALASEMTDNFGKRLKNIGARVRELTGDMQLSKTEIMETHMIITTPEKWDVVTRKPKGDIELLKLVQLLIIDEVHLLQNDRGPVLEALVSRTLRHVESTQQMIRIVGLSATLPNYVDVAEFLRVNPREGLFFFDGRFRPVPLGQTFIGVKATVSRNQNTDMDEICYEKVRQCALLKQQCMVFVHARNATQRLATTLKETAQTYGDLELFAPEMTSQLSKIISKPSHALALLKYGFAVHHAGLTRYDRNLVEKLFKEGSIRVLVCTATLAWGVNLPATQVIIRGTELYDPAAGTFVNLDVLDVMQIFGRAGRPQYDRDGFATIITSLDQMRYYLTILTCQYPIESQFMKSLPDNLNAEVSLGTVTNVSEAVEWLGYTYFFIRMRKNPLVYGITHDTVANDYGLLNRREEVVRWACNELNKVKMIQYDEINGYLDPTDLGRIASHYYIKYKTVEIFNTLLNPHMLEDAILNMICSSQEFDQLKSREEEQEELADLSHNNTWLKVQGSLGDKEGKVNVLLQSYLSRAKIESTSLSSDSLYIVQNAVRIVRGLFEYIVLRGFASLAHRLLMLSKMIEHQMWNFETPFRQFARYLTHTDFEKLERMNLTVDKIRSEEYSSKEISNLMRVESKGPILKKLAHNLPMLSVDASFHPITRTVLRVILFITPAFTWDDSINGKKSEAFWLWMQDADTEHIYHHEYYKIHKKQVVKKETQTLTFTIIILDPDHLPSHYIIHTDSDRWLGCNHDEAIACRIITIPQEFLPYTKLKNIPPKPVTALNNPSYQSLYRFEHFNPIQSQIFDVLFKSNKNVLLGAPTGSGKTISAEITIFRAFDKQPGQKIVYIAPLKALVKERVNDWKVRFGDQLGRRVIELTGDLTPDIRQIMNADIIVTTPEKWDGISRSWQTRQYVQEVCLMIIDEIHMLGEERGPVLEVIVSRTNFINSHTKKRVRIVGLSTAIANAQDLGNWLDIKEGALFNFSPAVRPVPIETHIFGFPGKHYCPRMASMNKPIAKAIKQHSPEKPVLIFVSSRRQTRLTAIDLITFLGQENPKQWLSVNEDELNCLIQNSIKDTHLKLTLSFGIGLHHAGLQEKERALVEELFLNQKIQVVIATATLAWGVNLPAHLVIIKGTEYYDGKIHRYVDFPITDVLQMMGRAGRPQFDTSGIAVILVQDCKKDFYQRFLYEPFPVESHLIPVLEDHLNAEIVSATLKTKSDCVEYLSWTYMFRRVFRNPSYYGLESSDNETINAFLCKLVDNSLAALMDSDCVDIDEDEISLISTFMGKTASFYYIHHVTVKMFADQLTQDDNIERLLHILCQAHEYNELPVRHNEDVMNESFAKECRLPIANDASYDCPHTKAYLLLQAHFSQLEMPCPDYITDLKSVLDQTIRIVQAMIDIAVYKCFLPTTLRLVQLLQMLIQGRWWDAPPCLMLPNVDEFITIFRDQLSIEIVELMHLLKSRNDALAYMHKLLPKLAHCEVKEIYNVLISFPIIDVELFVKKQNMPKSEQKIQLEFPNSPIKSRRYIPLESNTEYIFSLRVRRSNHIPDWAKQHKEKAWTPKFPKPKDEGWIAIVGDPNKRHVFALKRCGYVGNHVFTVDLNIRTPFEIGNYIYSIYFLSDSYYGLDQQYDLGIDVVDSLEEEKDDGCE